MERAILEETLAEIANTEQLRNLLFHERNEYLDVEDEHMFYRDPITGRIQRLAGLLPTLAAVFWPDDETKSRKRALARAKDRATKLARSHQKVMERELVRPVAVLKQDKSRPRQVIKGVARGSRVHKHIHHAMILDTRNFIRMHSTMHQYTQDILHFMKANDLIPIQAEFPVYDIELGICARFDMVAARADGTIVFLEFKTGYEHCFSAEGMSLAFPFAGQFRDSERIRAIIQLAFSICMAIRYYHKLQKFEAYVLRPTGSSETARGQIEKHALPHGFLRTYCALMYEKVRHHRQTRKANTTRNPRNT